MNGAYSGHSAFGDLGSGGMGVVHGAEKLTLERPGRADFPERRGPDVPTAGDELSALVIRFTHAIGADPLSLRAID